MNTSTAARFLAAGIAVAAGFTSIAGSVPGVTPPAPTISPITPNYTVRYADIQVKELRFVPGSNGSVLSKAIAGYRFIHLNVILKTLNPVGTPQFNVLGQFNCLAPLNSSQTSVQVQGMAGNSEWSVPIEIRVPDRPLGTNFCQLAITADSNGQVLELLRENNTVVVPFFLGRDEQGPFVGTIDYGQESPNMFYDCKHPVAKRMEIKAKVR